MPLLAKHDCLGRRSRFRRTPTGKRLFLGERDKEILRWLYRYRFLRAPQLIAFMQPKSEKRLIERLGDLYHETGLIDRPPAQWRSFDARYRPLIYELTSRGQTLLEQQGELPPRVTSLARRHRPGTTPQFDHAMLIVDTLVERELAASKHPSQRFVCVDEILAKAPAGVLHATKPLKVPVTLLPQIDSSQLNARLETHVVPDGLYGIEYCDGAQKTYRFFALECERTSPKRRSTTRLSSLELKQAAYRALIRSKQHRKVWGVPNVELEVVRCTGLTGER